MLSTTGPILALIAMGWLARRRGWLQAGDERVLNAYVYYFALPALFYCDLSGTVFDAANLRLALASTLPIFAAALAFALAAPAFGWSRETLHLLVLSAAFGSLGFFGIPFVSFAFGEAMDRTASLCAAAGSLAGVSLSLVVLESHGAGSGLGVLDRARVVGRRLLANPLFLSIALGTATSLSGLALPGPVLAPLHMLGRSTVTVALFLLGVFLYGRDYGELRTALGLSLLRAVLLPVLGLAACALLGVRGEERAVVVLMHAMPVAVAMIVLSERYDFRRRTVASLLLVSSLGAAVYLNVWLSLLR